MTDSFSAVQDTILSPSPSTDADNAGGISENITIIEKLRKEIGNTRLQMENLQKRLCTSSILEGRSIRDDPSAQ